MKKKYLLFIIVTGLLTFFTACENQAVHKTLIITGQNNHNWKASSPVLKQILDETGLFSAEIITTPDKGGNMKTFDPDFSKYKLVVIDYNGDSWSEKTNNAFVEYVKNGGGVVIYHASDNSFPAWKEYNEMTGLGGWGDRNQKDGPYGYYKNDTLVTVTSAGVGGSHDKRREFLVRTRITDHPITRDLPVKWLHGTDELYSQLRGPANNMQILATAYADTSTGGTTMRDEPMLITITYGKGRIFQTTMGHADEGGGPSMQCAGFISTIQRGSEWAITGNVTQNVPWDFPSAADVVIRSDFKVMTLDVAFGNIGNYQMPKSTKYLSCIQSHLRDLEGDEKGILKMEKMMVEVLKNSKATVESKKLLLRELSWMGSYYSVTAIKNLLLNSELKDEAEFALARLQPVK